MNEEVPIERQLTEQEGEKVQGFLKVNNLKSLDDCFDDGYCVFCEEQTEHFSPNNVKGRAFHVLDNHILEESAEE